MLASLVWLWFGAASSSPSKFVARALAFSALSLVGPPLARRVLFGVLRDERAYHFMQYFFDMAGIVLRVIVVTIGRRWVGRPDEVPWLPASRKAKMAATAPEETTMRSRKRAAVLLPLAVFVVSTLAHLATDTPRVAGSTASLLWLLYVYVAIIVVFTICVARFPKSPSTKPSFFFFFFF